MPFDIVPIVIFVCAVALFLFAAVIVFAVAKKKKKKNGDERLPREKVGNALPQNDLTNDACESAVPSVSENVLSEPAAASSDGCVADGQIIIGDLTGIDYDGSEQTVAEKIMLSGSVLKNRYDVINNKLLSFKNVKGVIEKRFIAYNCGGKVIARFGIKDGFAAVYLAFDTTDPTLKGYAFSDCSEERYFYDTPVCLKIKSDYGLTKAVSLIKALAKAKNIPEKNRYEAIDSTEALKRFING